MGNDDFGDKRRGPHSARMQRKKAVIDASIARATCERGILIVNTGTGKGKSTAAFGVLARALGHGQKCAVLQFVKNRADTGEEAFFRACPGVHWHVMGAGFTWETQDDDRDKACTRAGWDEARRYLRDETITLVILDELTYAINYGWLTLDEILAALDGRPRMQHVIITGRSAPAGLIEKADTVTDMTLKKHAYHAGVKAMAGIEW